MRILRGVRFSIAQSLVAMFMAAVACSTVVMFRRVWEERFPPAEVHDVHISPDDVRLGLALSDARGYSCLVCESRGGLCLGRAESPGERPTLLTLSRDLDTWAALLDDGTMEFGRIASQERRRVPASPELKRWLEQVHGSKLVEDRTPDPRSTRISVGADGSTCVLLYDEQVETFDVGAGRRMCSFTILVTPGHIRIRDFQPRDLVILGICISNDGDRLAVVTLYFGIEVWDTRGGKLLGCGGSNGCHGAAWSGDEALAFLEARSRGVNLLLGPGATCLSIMHVPRRDPNDASPTPRLFERLRDDPAEFQTGHLDPSPPLATGSDGQVIAALYENWDILVFDAATLQLRYRAKKAFIGESLAVSDDGRTVAVGLIASNKRGGEKPAPQHGITVVDMPTGTASPLWPRPRKSARYAAISAFVLLGLGVGVVLLIRLAPGRGARGKRESGSAIAG